MTQPNACPRRPKPSHYGQNVHKRVLGKVKSGPSKDT